jgi:gamma-glutamyltranspeptidase/glutathione hydrolase
MIATSHALASASGLATLRRGGSAADAAITANAILCVVYPHMAGLGGDGFWLIHSPQSGAVEALNASGPAAKKATIDYYASRGHRDEIPSRGALSALTVPGAVDGWREAHERYGRLEWSSLFDDAVHYSESGYPVGHSLADWLVTDAGLLSAHEKMAALFMPTGLPAREGARLTNPELAASFRTLAESGPRSFYEGEIASRICAALTPKGSPLEPSDFAGFRAEWVDPITTRYRDCQAYEFPPNTQGFAALQILNMIEGYDLVAWGDGSADYYHYMAEAVKLAFADRNAWLTDPRFVDIPLERLVDKSYATERRGLIDPERAMVMEDVQPGIAYRGEPATSPRAHGGDTCSFCVVDEDGLAVSVIQSIYHDFGSAEIGGDTGIILQNRGSFFSLNERHPNCLKPGKRTFHTLIPGMLCRDGKPWLVFGTMGGEGQPQTHAALVTRTVDFGYDIQQAIEAPRWLMGRTWGVKSQDLSLETRIPDPVIRELERRGQPVKPLTAWNDNMGHAQAIRIDRRTGMLAGGADPRGDGAALGY